MDSSVGHTEDIPELESGRTRSDSLNALLFALTYCNFLLTQRDKRTESIQRGVKTAISADTQPAFAVNVDSSFGKLVPCFVRRSQIEEWRLNTQKISVK